MQYGWRAISRLHIDFIAADLVVDLLTADLLTEDLSKGFVDQGHSMSGDASLDMVHLNI